MSSINLSARFMEQSDDDSDDDHEPIIDKSGHLLPCSCGGNGRSVGRVTEWRHRTGRCGRCHELSLTSKPSGSKRSRSSLLQDAPAAKTRRLQEDLTVQSGLQATSEIFPPNDPGSDTPGLPTFPSTSTSSPPIAPSLLSRWHRPASYEASSDSGTDSELSSSVSGSEDTEWESESDGYGDDEFDGQTGMEGLGEAFEREAASSEASKLSDVDLEILRAMRMKVQDNLSGRTFGRLSRVFRTSSLPSLSLCKRRLHVLAGYEPEYYDMCIKSCISYAPDAYRDLTACPLCKHPRHDQNGHPYKRYRYNPFTPRLLARQADPVQAELMQYRARHSHTPGRTTDYFDSSHYQSKISQHVEVNGERLKHKHFSDHRDIALALSTDGFAPFKRRKVTCWPVILFNLNLPPDIRYHLENIICLAEIPGPTKPKDWCSFIWPALVELTKLAHGVQAFDGLSQALFALHAYLLYAFGDMPAVALMMRMLGHNAIQPCRTCLITGVRIPDKPKVTTHYVPLNRSQHPDSPLPAVYDPSNLPLRDHISFMEEAQKVQSTRQTAARERLQKKSGIKGLAALSTLSSISFPDSFPHDPMHLFFENVIPSLVSMWTGKYKDWSPNDDFVLAPTVFEAIAEAGHASGKTIPSSFGAPVPNISTQRNYMTAETWNFWSTFVAPVLLRRRFKRDIYYKHFIALVKLIKICLQYEYTDEDINQIEQGFIEWVKEFERLYYRYKPSRLACCTLNIHALLHVAHDIRRAGPVWVYWAFAMERYCGRLGPAVKSRRWPWPSLDEFIETDALLSQVKYTYHLDQSDDLDIEPQRTSCRLTELIDPAYPDLILTNPFEVRRLTKGQENSIAKCLSALYGQAIRTSRAVIPEAVEHCGRLRIAGGGDTIQACDMVKRSKDSRDATFVRYQVAVDKKARNHRATPEFEVKDFWGQLRNIFILRLNHDAAQSLGLDPEPGRVLFLAEITQCRVEAYDDMGNKYYKDMGATEVVDLKAVQCVVGRIFEPARKQWAIIDRSGPLAQASFSLASEAPT